MATITPFPGFTYDSEALNGKSLLYKWSPFQKSEPSLKEACFGELVPFQDEPSLYGHRVDYRTPSGLEKSRTGLIARIDPFKTQEADLIPLVETGSRSVEREVEHLKTTGLKTELMVAAYEDPQFEIQRVLERELEYSPFVSEFGDQTHVISPINGRRPLERLINTLRKKKCFLIDGLHHLRAARRLRDLTQGSRERIDGIQSGDLYPLTLMINILDFGSALGAYHYVVPKGEDFDLNRYVLKCDRCFNVKNYGWSTERERKTVLRKFREDLRIQGTAGVTAGACFHGEPQFFLFTLKTNSNISNILPPEVLPDLQYFPALYVQRLLIERFYWQCEGDTSLWNQVELAPTMEEACTRMEEGGYGAVFFLNPPSKRHLLEVAWKGKRFPFGSVRLDPPPPKGLLVDKIKPPAPRPAP